MWSYDVSDSDFVSIRTGNKYYVDKSLFIQEFVEQNEKITLITRPRRFGKTTMMTMLADFFDIEKDSARHFEGLAIMDTEYASLMNTRPVIFLSFRDCDGTTEEELRLRMNQKLFHAMEQLHTALQNKMNPESNITRKFYLLLEKLLRDEAGFNDMANALEIMIRLCNDCYHMSPLVLIDEYDQPLLASHVNQYHQKIGNMLGAFYTNALKDNPFIYRALMTGIQRIAKESIFSKFNNPAVYTVMDKAYSTQFGFTEKETEMLLKDAGLELNDTVREMYDGYRFGEMQIYNPSSIMGYAQHRELRSYWVNTSSNKLIYESISVASQSEEFRMDYEELLEKGSATVLASLTTSYMELSEVSTLWGLLINAGYLTIKSHDEIDGSCVMIPNKEVREEFIRMIAQEIGTAPNVLQSMFQALDVRNINQFQKMYRKLILTCTSYHDGRENAYHMFFLGMCVFLYGKYKVTSNLESGYGRHDIILEPLRSDRKPVVVEFKQVNADVKANLLELAEEALQQIKDQKYYSLLRGNILLLGIAHQVKKCEIVYEEIEYNSEL